MKYELNTLKQAELLVAFCRQFEEDIDVKHQRYTIDAKSILGVSSLVSNTVEIDIVNPKSDITREKFFNGLRKL